MMRQWVSRNPFRAPSREFRFIPGNQVLVVVGIGDSGELLVTQTTYLGYFFSIHTSLNHSPCTLIADRVPWQSA